MSESNITKRALAESMKTLMANEPFSKISVGDICEHCGMSRKSFYYHFRDKYDIVNWIFSTEFMSRVAESEYDSTWDFLMDICAYFYENRKFYVNAFSVEGQNSFADCFAETLGPVLLVSLRDQVSDDEFHDFYCQFFTDAMRCAIVRWLNENKQMPPEQFVSLCRRTLEGAAARILQTRT